MTADAQELLQICKQLPEAKRAEVTDFARFLLAREDDAAWEATIADDRKRPKLDAFLAASRSEGSEPLDPERL